MQRSAVEWTLRHPAKFGTVTVRAGRDGTRRYEQRGGNQSTIDANGISLEIYIHALHGLVLQHPGRKVLVIGCAGGSLATMLVRAGRDVTLVDIDPAAFKIAKRYFGLAAGIACRVGDGLRFMQKTQTRFDAVIVDAFIGEAIPDHFSGARFVKAARRCTKRGGLILVNVCLDDRKDRRADEIARGFEEHGILVKLLDEPGGARNAVVAAGNVGGLRRPRVTSPPCAGAARLLKGVTAMKFRKITAPSGVPPSKR